MWQIYLFIVLSREHGLLAIKAKRASCVIAETCSDFYRNAINIGLPIVECPEAAKGIEDGDEVEVILMWCDYQ